MDNTKVLLRSKLNLGFNLNYFSFYRRAYRIILFYITTFKNVYPRINETNIHSNIIGILSFQNGLKDYLISTGLYSINWSLFYQLVSILSTGLYFINWSTFYQQS